MSWIGVCDAEQVQEDFPFSGNVDGKEIGVYLLEAVFEVKTGLGLHGPGGRNLNRYPVRVFENQIQITFVEETVA